MTNPNLDPKLISAIAANVKAQQVLSKPERDAALQMALAQIALEKGERVAAAVGFMFHMVYAACLADLAGKKGQRRLIEGLASKALPMLQAFGLDEKELLGLASPIVDMQLETARALLQQAVWDAKEDVREGR